MTHDEARRELLDHRRGRLAGEQRRALEDHLAGCPACARAGEAEVVLDELLRDRLPRPAASPELRRRLAALAERPPPQPAPPGAAARPARRWLRVAAPALAAAFAAATTAVLVDRAVSRTGEALATLTSEAVNDHLRVLRSTHPLDVEAGGTHQVKPWFEGRIGFAPSVPSPVRPDMRLEGGGVGWFLDREAAVVVYGLRLHRLTLLAFRADGLPWPGGASGARWGPLAAASSRGFHVVLWRRGELGYALVSDVDPAELSAVAAELAGQT